MAIGFSQKLNAFQQERAPHIATDESIHNSIDEMIQSGTLPTGRRQPGEINVGLIKKTQQHFENEDFSEDLWFDVATQQYKFNRKYKNGNRKTLAVNGTLQDISDARKHEDASLEREAEEAARIPTEKEKAVRDWMANYKFGAEAKAYLDILPENHARRFVQIIWTYFDQLFGKAAYTPEGINSAYVEAWDAGKLDGYMHEADRLAQEAEQTRIAQSAQPVAPLSPTPSSNLPKESDERKLQDQVNRNKPLKELRREALFLEKGSRVPSTGTVLR